MNRLLRDLGLILVLAALWAISGYAIGAAIEITGEMLDIGPYPFKVIMASINVIIGLLLFKGITRDPTAERLFFEGPNHEEEGDFRIGCLWVLPASLLLFGLLMWLWAVILRFVLSR